jgi:dolichyl-phosphate-mannose-protein mannosyltransferase
MRTVLALYALAVTVRLVLIALYPDPAYVDSYYYVNVARALHAGHGFNIDFIWTFVDLGGSIPANPGLPIPSNAHWMPLASLVQVPFLAVIGVTPWASALPFALIGSLAAPMTWAFALEAGARRDVALGAALLVALPAAVVFMPQPDNFSLYQPIVLGALWLGARGLKGDPRSFAAAGALVGLAMLARNDGILVGAALGLLFVWRRLRAWRSGRPAVLPWWSAAASLGLFVLIMAPWWARQLTVFGSISPSSASGRILWIRSLAEMNSIEGHPTLSTFLAQGIGSIASSRIVGFVQALVSFVVLVGGVVLAPAMVVGAWLRRRSPDFAPFFVYALILFAFSALVSAVHVPNGTFIHSAIALAPQAYILALEGVVAVAAWLGARRSWDVPAATRAWVAAAVVLTMLVGVWFSFTTRAVWTAERDIKVDAGMALRAAGAPSTDVVMSLDTAGVKFWTGHPGVVAPADPIDTIERVARAYGARWLLVERKDTVAALAPLLKEPGLHPAWIGPSIWRQPAGVPSTNGTDAVGSDAALFPICIDQADPRCQA